MTAARLLYGLRHSTVILFSFYAFLKNGARVRYDCWWGVSVFCRLRLRAGRDLTVKGEMLMLISGEKNSLLSPTTFSAHNMWIALLALGAIVGSIFRGACSFFLWEGRETIDLFSMSVACSAFLWQLDRDMNDRGIASAQYVCYSVLGLLFFRMLHAKTHLLLFENGA